MMRLNPVLSHRAGNKGIDRDLNLVLLMIPFLKSIRGIGGNRHGLELILLCSPHSCVLATDSEHALHVCSEFDLCFRHFILRCLQRPHANAVRWRGNLVASDCEDSSEAPVRREAFFISVPSEVVTFMLCG